MRSSASVVSTIGSSSMTRIVNPPGDDLCMAATRPVCARRARSTKFDSQTDRQADRWAGSPLAGEALALVREPVQERRRGPEGVAALPFELEQPVAQGLEPGRIGPEHRAAAVDGPAVAVDPDHVDVARANRDLLLQDLGALVDRRI